MYVYIYIYIYISFYLYIYVYIYIYICIYIYMYIHRNPPFMPFLNCFLGKDDFRIPAGKPWVSHLVCKCFPGYPPSIGGNTGGMAFSSKSDAGTTWEIHQSTMRRGSPTECYPTIPKKHRMESPSSWGNGSRKRVLCRSCHLLRPVDEPGEPSTVPVSQDGAKDRGYQPRTWGETRDF